MEQAGRRATSLVRMQAASRKSAEQCESIARRWEPHDRSRSRKDLSQSLRRRHNETSESSAWRDRHTAIDSRQDDSTTPCLLLLPVPALRSLTTRPLGISTLPATWLGPSNHFDYLDNLFEAVPIEQWDRIDVTDRVDCDFAILHDKVGDAPAHRLVLSDFKVDDSVLTPADYRRS